MRAGWGLVTRKVCPVGHRPVVAGRSSPAAVAARSRRRLRDRFSRQLRAAAVLAGLAQLVTTTLELWTASYISQSLGAARRPEPPPTPP